MISAVLAVATPVLAGWVVDAISKHGSEGRVLFLAGSIATVAVLDACPGAAVVCLTAEATDPEDDAVRAAGAAALVRKGGPISELVAAVQAAAGRHR